MSWCPTHKITSEARPQLFGALCEWWHWPYHTLTISFHMCFLKPLPGKKWRCTVWHQRPWHSTKTKIFTIFDPLMQINHFKSSLLHHWSMDTVFLFNSWECRNALKRVIRSIQKSGFYQLLLLRYCIRDPRCSWICCCRCRLEALGLYEFLTQVPYLFPPIIVLGLITNWIQLI